MSTFISYIQAISCAFGRRATDIDSMIGRSRRFSLPIAAVAVALLAASAARADTTVAEYLQLENDQRAHILGSLLQSLADDLQANNRSKDAQCLVALYSAQSEARVVRSTGMMDFLQSVEVAREDDPKETTLEQIISRQLVQYCGLGKKS